MSQEKTTVQRKQDAERKGEPSTSPPNANVTTVDVQLADAYYPLLVEIARDKKRVSYGELVAKAKLKYPDSTVVQKAIPAATGRRLDVVRLFTSARNLPDLASLVVNQASGVTRSSDPEAARDAVFAFDWNTVVTQFGGFIKQTEATTKHRKKVREPVALGLMSAHYLAHREALPERVRELRSLIVGMIMEGNTVEEAFERALQDA
jgi:hypothetical protein